MSHTAKALAENKAQLSENNNLMQRAAEIVEAHWITVATQPISQESAAGINCRLEEGFEKIKLEIAKLDSLTNVEPIDWEQLSLWCRDILESQSKDLLVICYLTRALCEFQLLDGLITGTFISIHTLDKYWENCFPPKKRKKGRGAAYEWLSERCLPLIEKNRFNIGQIDRLVLAIALLKQLDRLLLEKLDSDAPAINELINPLKRTLSGLETEKKAKERKASESTSKPPIANAKPLRTTIKSQATEEAETSLAIGEDRGLQNCYRSTRDSLRAACDFLRSQNLGDPEPYRINRFITWLGISQLPPDNNGVTQLRPPGKEKLQYYQGLMVVGKHRELIPEVENSISRTPYWLDGHRLVAESLEACGHTDAAIEVALGVSKFIERFPKVVNLKFSDQTEFADDVTKQWIKLSLQSRFLASGSEVTNLPVNECNKWENAYQEALKLFRKKQQSKAFALFQAGCKQCYSKRELIFWRFYQAKFCYETKQPKLAAGLLESMLSILENLGVNDWEPDVTAKIIELLIRCYQLYSEQDIPKTRVAALHEHLCQFDLATAYELSTH